MKVSKTYIVDVPCPLCHNSETTGPYECKRCGLEVCMDCLELTGIGADRHRQRILCTPCVSAVEAELALESLAGPTEPEPKPSQKQSPLTKELIEAFRRTQATEWPPSLEKDAKFW